ncbi:MAG: hypothetical protein K1060chlam1_01281 [Candidatus Anoxychlamydiales bacterium]|nr:hypothetical protein [Candidatus Anoxychlamydiales bacterium]
MILKDLDKFFTRAFLFSFNKKKLFFTYPFIFLIGIIHIFFRSLVAGPGTWTNLSFIFLPIFISFAILFVLGVFLARIYFHDVKNLKCSYMEILKKSVDKISYTFYISILSIVAFVILWIIFGFLAAIKDIPHIGSFIGVFISIVAYILILFFIVLVILNLLFLFFLTPSISLKPKLKIKGFFEILKNLKKNIFVNFSLFLIAVITVFIPAFLLFISASLTKSYFAIRLDSIYLGLESFFIMLPVSILITPFVIFFFNFAIESFNILHKKTESSNG